MAALITLVAMASLAVNVRGDEPAADTALVIAVDVSQSVDAARYKIQMDGIASAFEDPGVIAAITGGTQAQILITLVTWSDTAETALPWTLIRSQSDALSVAAVIRALPSRTGEFTCMARMLRALQSGALLQIPMKANRVVIDVSGDGIDNCDDTPATGIERDQIVAEGGTINGLPIILAGENDQIVGSGAYRKPGYDINSLSPDKDTTTLDTWYRTHVIGGRGAFIMPAKGYEDFGRAFRQKFVTEVSAYTVPPPRKSHKIVANQ
ncbi:MAG: DUF1194 domain-containing protein [Hyphomicrobium sp.]|nr:DUF1194 domain-containing protein [Hyphomicrobium sp.]